MIMDMDYREKILDALDFLKEMCGTMDACEDCPLGDDNGCCRIAQVRPIDWDVKTSPDYEVWRAFDI